MSNSNSNGSWSKWQKLVLYRLEQQDKRFDHQDKKLDKIDSTLTGMRVKVAAISGAMGFLGALLLKFVTGN